MSERNRHGVPILRDVAATKAFLLDADPRAKPKPEKRKRSRPKRPPACPPWLDAAEYEALLELRKGLGA